MTREQAKINLESLGFEEVTPELITNYLNQVGGETKKEKELAEKYKSDAIRVKDLESQLEELNNKNLSDIDLAKKETEKSNSRVAELEKQISIMQRKNELANLGIVGETADKLFNEDGSVDFLVLGQIISERETTAKSLKEKELLDKTPNPEGSDKKEKDKDDALLSSIIKDFSGVDKTASDIVNSYI